jgi:hypothetical protein
MSVTPLDVEAEVNFECPVCFATGSVLPIKYKCTNCDKKICDDCFARHVVTKRSCAFCRAPLSIAETDLKDIESRGKCMVFCVQYRRCLTVLTCILCTWYTLMFIHIFAMSGFRPYNAIYNHTYTE